MKFATFVIATIAILGSFISIEAAPGKSRPYGQIPRPPPRPPLRVRRQAVGGSVSTNPKGGNDVRLEVAKGIGTPQHNIIGEAFAAGNTKGGPVTTGGKITANTNGLSLGIGKEKTPGISESLSKTAQANLFNNGVHSVNAGVSQTSTKLANGFNFDKNSANLGWQHKDGHSLGIARETIPGFQSKLTQSANVNVFKNDLHSVDANAFRSKTSFAHSPSIVETGGGLNWNHAGGHAANVGLTKINDFGTRFDAGGKANLFTSRDGNTQLGLTAGGSRWLSGPLQGRNDFNVGGGITHYFG